MSAPDTKISEMDSVSAVLDADVMMLIRSEDNGDTWDSYQAALLIYKNYFKAETSQELTANGAVPLNKNNIVLNVGVGGTVNLTLANGSENQVITFIAKTLGSNVIVTPANFTSTNFRFTLAGQTITIKFKDGKWYVINNYGTTIG